MKSGSKEKDEIKNEKLLNGRAEKITKEQFAALVPTPSSDRVRSKVDIKDFKSSKKLELEEPKSQPTISVYLTPHQRLLCAVYKAVCVVFKFNQERNLNLIFCRYRNSIERMVKRTVTETMIKELARIVTAETMKIKEIVYEKQRTLKIDILRKIDIEFVMKTAGRTTEEVIVARVAKEKVCSDNAVSAEGLERKTGRYEEILRRVKAREAARRKKFIELEKENLNVVEKINEIFKVTGARSIKLGDLNYKLGSIFRGEEEIRKIVKNNSEGSGGYKIVKINGEEYVVIKNVWEE